MLYEHKFRCDTLTQSGDLFAELSDVEGEEGIYEMGDINRDV